MDEFERGPEESADEGRPERPNFANRSQEDIAHMMTGLERAAERERYKRGRRGPLPHGEEMEEERGRKGGKPAPPEGQA